MLELRLPRALVITTLTLAATFAAGAAQAEPPLPPAPPAAAPPATERPAKAGHVYAPPGYPEPHEETALGDDSATTPQTAPRWDGRPAGLELGYGAPASYAISPEQQPSFPPETHMRSVGLVAGGVVLLGFGMVGLFAGSSMVSAHEPTANQPNTCIDCNLDGSGSGIVRSPAVILKPGFQTAGIATLIGSVLAIGAAIPLVVIGAKKVPYADSASPAAKAAKLTPSIGVGPGSATLVWQF